MRSLHYQLFVKCRPHSCSNATKWGLARWTTEEILDTLWQAVASCISCSSDLVDMMGEFIAQRVVYDDADWPMQVWLDRQQMWNWLVDVSAMVDLVLRVNPRWDPDQRILVVSSWIRDEADGLQTLRHMLEYFTNWIKFTLTRFGTVSRSCRRWLASLLLGLDGWFILCREAPHTYNYHTTGHFKGQSFAVRRAAIVACFSGGISEGVGQELLHDDRFLLHAHDLWLRAIDDLNLVLEIRTQVWEWFAELLGDGYSAQDLRGDAVWSSLTTLAYMYKDSFDELQHLPLRLTQGSLEDNVEWVRTVDKSELAEDFALTMREAMDLGVAPRVWVQILKLARDMPCSTNLVEQGHGSAAAALSQRVTSVTLAVQVRSSVHQCRGCFQENEEDAISEHFGNLIAAKKKQLEGNRFSPQAAFLKYFLQDPDGERPPGLTDQQWSRCAFARHQQRFRALPWQRKQEFEAEADARQLAKKRVLAQEIEELRAAKSAALRSVRFNDSMEQGIPNLASSHSLSQEDLRRCQDVMEQVRENRGLESIREGFLKSAMPLDEALVKVMKNTPALFAASL